ncbi:hypothetical protein V5F79_00185 [Xanthobacter flavus]|uniref:hypothetical protein n=1 Tax=Xanthobacter flavus TaxID=281 RepID=UPI003729E5A4
MAAPDLAAALAAVRARRADAEDEEEMDPGPIDHDREDEADVEGHEDAARRSREASLSRADLIDYAQFRGVRLSREEQSTSIGNLRKIVLERLASLAVR